MNVSHVFEIFSFSPPVTSSLHAKFEVTAGPSVPAQAVAQFACDGGSLSGLTLEILSPSYRVSLLKNKCSAGTHSLPNQASLYGLLKVPQLSYLVGLSIPTYIELAQARFQLGLDHHMHELSGRWLLGE